MEFLVLNKTQMEMYKGEIPYIIIGATEPRSCDPTLKEDPKRVDELRLRFTDIDDPEDAKKYGQEGMLFSDEQCTQVWDFVSKYTFEDPDQLVELIICQCDGGMCRSAAFAAAIETILNGRSHGYKWFDHKLPNNYVYRKLMLEAKRRKYGHFGKYTSRTDW